jgi:hypothetical protein
MGKSMRFWKMGKNVLIVAIIAIISTTGCVRPDRKNVPASKKFLGLIDYDQFKPRAYRNQLFDHVPYPEHTPQSDYDQDNLSYETGFQDGCQTASSAINEGLFRLRGPKIDADRLVKDDWYLRGFRDSSDYCTNMVDWEVQ